MGGRTGEVEKALAEVDQVGQARLDVLLKVLHGHRRLIKEFVGDFVGPPQHLGDTDMLQDVQDLIQDAARKEAAILSFDVLAKGHLQQAESHVASLDDITLTGHGMIASGGLAVKWGGREGQCNIQEGIFWGLTVSASWP